ncbi:YveK family protein [Clostridium arbusti]|uniref:YveK family protein n=1 Tax=Clostridium arbusti TaxID=1137848 RepID=UPI0002890BEF|nr:Wzz/FepE/Etk N-terminal domain-containing protein [Clostridium arbusti]
MKDQNVIDLNEVLCTVKKRKGLVIAITLAAVAIAVIVSYFIMSPVYESSSTIIIGQKSDINEPINNQYSSVMMYQSLTKTYASLVTSKFIEEKAAQKLGRGITANQLNNSITVTPQDETQLIVIKAEGSTAEEALQRVNAVSETFSENVANIYNIGQATVVDKGELPQSPIKPNKKLYIAISLFMGLLLSIAIAISLERRTEKVLEKIKNHNELCV